MAYYTATIEVLVEVDDYGEACDAISEALRNLCWSEDSCWRDWHYRWHEGLNQVSDPKLIDWEEAKLRFIEA